MEEIKTMPKPHPHSKLMFIISAIVAIIALSGSGYYYYKIRQVKTAKQTPAQTGSVATTQKTTGSAAAPASTGTTAAATSEITKDLKDVNLDEIKTTIAEIKTAMSSFNK